MNLESLWASGANQKRVTEIRSTQRQGGGIFDGVGIKTPGLGGQTCWGGFRSKAGQNGKGGFETRPQ